MELRLEPKFLNRGLSKNNKTEPMTEKILKAPMGEKSVLFLPVWVSSTDFIDKKSPLRSARVLYTFLHNVTRKLVLGQWEHFPAYTVHWNNVNKSHLKKELEGFLLNEGANFKLI